MKTFSRLTLIFSFAFLTTFQGRGQGSLAPSAGPMKFDLNFDEAFRDLTVATSFVNITFTTLNIYKLNNPKVSKGSQNLKPITPVLFFVSGALQTAIGIDFLSSQNGKIRQLGFPNIIVGTATSVTSLIRIFKKNTEKEKATSFNIIPYPIERKHLGIGCHFAIQLN